MNANTNYFTLPNGLTEIEFGGDWSMPLTVIPTGEINIKMDGNILLTFSDGDTLFSNNAYQQINTITYGDETWNSNYIPYNNTHIDKANNSITISGVRPLKIVDYKFYVSFKTSAGALTDRISVWGKENIIDSPYDNSRDEIFSIKFDCNSDWFLLIDIDAF